MKILFRRIIPILVLTAGAAAAAVELKRETAVAFDRYVATLEAAMEARMRGGQFIRSAETPEHRRELLQGAVVVIPAQGNGEVELKAGLIHDWIGALFIPRTTLAKTVAIVQDYRRQREFYSPEIVDARVKSQNGNDFNVFMRIVKSKFFITDVLDTDHEIHFVPINANRMYCRSYSRRIAEVSDPGKPSEHELPVGNDRGLLWRMYGYWFFEEKDGGVYVEYESVTLSRDIPFGMGRVLGPILHNVPAEALRSSLEKTRRAVSLN